MISITAAQGDQFASWDEDAKHGLFTKHLLEALEGNRHEACIPGLQLPEEWLQAALVDEVVEVRGGGVGGGGP